jgi:hypothetical protein
MQIEEARPPYVTFEVRAVEDRQASIESRYYQTKDVDFAFVTPQGSKDRIEREVKSWFDQLAEQTRQGRFKQEWLTAYTGAYEAWKTGRELPLNGTAILTWPVLSPSQSKQVIDSGLRSVEDLAAANEEAIGRLGMGGRALKDKAVSWLSAAAGNGKVTEEMAALKASNKDLEARNSGLEKQLKELAAKVAALSK